MKKAVIAEMRMRRISNPPLDATFSAGNPRLIKAASGFARRFPTPESITEQSTD